MFEFTLKDTQQCEESNMFQCQDGTCLSKEKVCDGIFDCKDEEDELECEKNVSPSRFNNFMTMVLSGIRCYTV